MEIRFTIREKQVKDVSIDAPVAEKVFKKARAAALDTLDVAKEICASSDRIKYDIEQIKERDPAATSDLEVALLYSGFHALIAHRIANAYHKRGYKLTARAISQAAKFVTGIEIHPAAKIGKGLFIDHGSGVVIGETTEIGDDCTIYQGVTLGGTGKQCGKRHPTLGNNVMVGAGAKVLGPFTVGNNSKIAAGAVVLKEVPNDATAVGIPAKMITKSVTPTNSRDLDQINIPDPIAKELAELRSEIELLKQILKEKEEEN